MEDASPSGGASSFSIAIREKFAKDWYNSTASYSALESIAHLIRELGERNHSIYNGSDGTSTIASDVRANFINLGYTVSNIKNYNGEIFLTQLQSNKLMYVRGNIAGTNAGHAWVVDGAYYYEIHHSEWIKYAGASNWTFYRDAGTTIENYTHINWGWDGSCNGYFSTGVFNTQQKKVYDNPNSLYGNGTNYDFTEYLMYFEVTH